MQSQHTLVQPNHKPKKPFFIGEHLWLRTTLIRQEYTLCELLLVPAESLLTGGTKKIFAHAFL